MAEPHCPDRGDIIWLSLNPQSGHEQAGRRPALALSPSLYNRKVGLVLADIPHIKFMSSQNSPQSC